MGDLTTLDLEDIITAGDSQAWSLEDWNWDAINFSATPKHDIVPTSCRAVKRQRSGDGPFLDSSLTNANRAEPANQTTLGGCHALANTSLLSAPGSMSGIPLQPALWPETTCTVAGSTLVPLQHLEGACTNSLPSSGLSVSSATLQEHSLDSADSSPSEGPSLSQGRTSPPAASADQLAPNVCQADGCGLSLLGLSAWHRRCHVCEVHNKALVFTRGGVQLRFCQQCGRAHELTAFEGRKHSCRDQLAKHNARRRKRQALATQAASPVKASIKAQPSVAVTGPQALPAMSISMPLQPAPACTASSVDVWPRQQPPGMLGPLPGAATLHQPHMLLQTSAGPTAGATPWSPTTELPQGSVLMAEAPSSSQPQQQLLLMHPTPGQSTSPGPLPAASTVVVGVSGPVPMQSSATMTPGSLSPVLLVPAPAGSQALLPSIACTSSSLDMVLPRSAPDSNVAALASAAVLGDSFDQALALMRQPSQQQHAQRSMAQPASLPLHQQGSLATSPWQLSPSGQHAQQQWGQTVTTAGTHRQYFPENLVARLSVKLFNCTPTELPDDLRQQLTGWLKIAPAGAEGYIRPGCVHLTLQAHVARESHAALRSTSATAAVDHLLSAGDAAHAGLPSLWNTHAMLVQLDSQLALVGFGQLVATWDVTQASSAGQTLAMRPLPRLPVILSTSPVCMTASNPQPMLVSGTHLMAPDCEVLVRSNGGYVAVEVQHLSSSSDHPGQDEQQLLVHLRAGLPPGTAFLEVQKGAFASQPVPILVLDDCDAALVEEVNCLADSLSIGSATRATLEGLLVDLGVLARHQHSMHGTMREGMFADPHVARTAATLAAYACKEGLPQIAAFALLVASEVGGLDACCAADSDGLTLLHHAVRSRSLETVQAVLDVCPAMVLQAGPAGITPLHLAALVADGGAIALELAHACPPHTALAWFAHPTADGLTPADFAMRAGQPGVNALVHGRLAAAQPRLLHHSAPAALSPSFDTSRETSMAAQHVHNNAHPSPAMAVAVTAVSNDSEPAPFGEMCCREGHEPGTPPRTEEPPLQPLRSDSTSAPACAACTAQAGASASASNTVPVPDSSTVPGALVCQTSRGAGMPEPQQQMQRGLEVSAAHLHMQQPDSLLGDTTTSQFDIEAPAPAASAESQALIQASCSPLYACRPRPMALPGSLFGQRPTITLLAMVACIGSCIMLLHGWAM